MVEHITKRIKEHQASIPRGGEELEADLREDNSLPQQDKEPRELEFRTEQKEVVREEIEQMLRKDAIIQVKEEKSVS
ncbi:hypothetical protein NDU88_004817 [Pleurodeles waltl]|uniref:Uncharacterized protein n=1 Tax=Pleurodeles waltl TaxID=8319 RepID=A0AAV7TSK2_PLEWA|nr:hypothetical protein NDU88_004817 [Pleurodeles waltl]